MTLKEFFNEIENQAIDTYIVTLKYKYEFEENYTIENQILEYDSVDDSYAWLNDWFEGQTDVEVLGYMLLGDVDTTKLEPCEDCISKAEVINTVHKIIYGFFDIADDDSEEPINDKDKLLLTINKTISNAVKALPSVTPSRPRGKWIHWTDDYKDYVTCSCCEYGEEGEVLLSDKTPFCPICGADMRESEDKE